MTPLDTQENWNHKVRGETPHQRLDRNYAELLQEVRVAQTGTQLLLAFLLAAAFTPRFADLTDFQRALYVVSLVLGCGATALLIAPSAYHRVVYQRQLKHYLVRCSNWFAHFGLAMLMLALSSSMMLILDVVLGTQRAVWITGGVLMWFVMWWYVLPMWARARNRQRL